MNLIKPDIITTIESAGFEPKRKGNSFWLSCPFHEDKTPSLKINPERQSFYCFGCGSHGSVIDFIMALHGLSFKDACKYLNLQKPLKINSEQQKKRALVNDFREWEKSLRAELTDFYRDFQSITRDLRTMEEVEEYEAGFHLMPIVEWYLEIHTNGNEEERYNLYKRIER